MTTNTNAALRTIADWPITDPSNMDAANMAAVARAALTTAAAQPPAGWVMVPHHATNYMVAEGMKHSGALDCWRAMLAAAPKAEPAPATNQECEPVDGQVAMPPVTPEQFAADIAELGGAPARPAGEYPPLPGPERSSYRIWSGGWLFTADQMRAYYDLGRAQPAVAPAAPAAVEHQGVVAWMHPETLDVIHAERKQSWSEHHGMGGAKKAEGYTVPLGRLEPAAVAPQEAAPGAQGDAEDAARWRETLMHVGAATHLGGQHFTLNTLRIVDQMFLLRGSVAQHFTKCIDASLAARSQQDGKRHG